MAIKYLDAKRLRGSSTASGVATPTYDTTFSSSSNWTLTDKGSSLDIDTGNSKLTFSLNASSLDDNIRYDLQHADALDGSNVDNSKWIIRFKLKFDNINDNGTANQESPMIWFGIGDTANPSGRVPSGDYLRFGFGLGDNEIKNKLQGINGGSNDDDNTNNNPVHYSSTSTTPFYYCEIQRVSATSATFKMRTGSHSGTQVGSTITNTLSAGSSIINLRYLSIYTYSETMSGTGMTGYITDLEFYNNVDSTTTTIDEKATLITTFSDSLGTSADGSLIGDPTGGDTSPTPPSGLGTSSFNFDGNDAINIDGAEPFSTTVGSISLWWYNDGSTNDDMILVFGDTNASSYLGFETKTGGLKVAFRSSSATQWEVRRATGGSNGGTMSVGWHNMIVSQNGTAVLVYVDGVSITNFDTSTDKSKWMESNIDNGRIGCHSISGGGNTTFFTGNIMEIGLWNVALTSTQVASIYGNGGSTAKKANTEPVGLRAYYPLSGTTVTNELADYSDLPENTLFEETDTFSTHWLQDNIWKTTNRGVIFGDGSSNSIDYINPYSTGNATQFQSDNGISENFDGGGAGGNATYAVASGTTSNSMPRLSFWTVGSSVDWADLERPRKDTNGCSNDTKYVTGGGYANSDWNTFMSSSTMDTSGNSSDFGDLTVKRYGTFAFSSATRCVFAGGYNGSTTGVTTQEFVTFASGGTCSTSGSLIGSTNWMSDGCSNSTIGLWAGGYNASNQIQKQTIASLGTSTDWGDLTTGRHKLGSLATSDRAVFAGGSSNVIDYKSFTSSANATDFGDLNFSAAGAGASDLVRT